MRKSRAGRATAFTRLILASRSNPRRETQERPLHGRIKKLSEIPRKPGRPRGARNKVTAPIKEAAQKYTDDALKALVSIMKTGESEAARVAAANAILDRGHGKPKQAIDVDADVRATVQAIERRIVDP